MALVSFKRDPLLFEPSSHCFGQHLAEGLQINAETRLLLLAERWTDVHLKYFVQNSHINVNMTRSNVNTERKRKTSLK